MICLKRSKKKKKKESVVLFPGRAQYSPKFALFHGVKDIDA